MLVYSQKMTHSLIFFKVLLGNKCKPCPRTQMCFRTLNCTSISKSFQNLLETSRNFQKKKPGFFRKILKIFSKFFQRHTLLITLHIYVYQIDFFLIPDIYMKLLLLPPPLPHTTLLYNSSTRFWYFVKYTYFLPLFLLFFPNFFQNSLLFLSLLFFP